MKIKFILSMLLIVLLVSGSGCVKKEATTVKETTEQQENTEISEPVQRLPEVIKTITERTKGLDPGQVSYFYYKIDANNVMKIIANSENNFNAEIMSKEDCSKKTKEQEYNAEIKKENINNFEFESRGIDIKDEAKEWCVAVTNIEDKYTSISVKIDELIYK